jgi:ornithine cyclodeaminase
MQELDEFIVSGADLFVCDSRAAAWKEAGDLVIPARKGLIDMSRIDAEVGDLVLGRAPGRRDDREITVYKGVGLAALDLAAAQAVFAGAEAAGIGTAVDVMASD